MREQFNQPLYNRSWQWEPIVIERNRDPGAVCRAVSLVMPSKMVVGRKQHARLIENRLEALLFIHEVPSAVAVSSSLMKMNCRTRFAAASGSSQRGSSSSKASMLL